MPKNNKKLTTDLFKGHRNEFRKKTFVCDKSGHPDLLGNYILCLKCLEVLELEEFIKGLKYFSLLIGHFLECKNNIYSN